MNNFTSFIILLGWLASFCNGHGMMIDPVGRASRWRTNSSAPPNYDDSQTYCGGFGVQFGINNGKCGICGDDYREKLPRHHEFGGIYGEGIVVKTYKAGGTIDVVIDLRTNHWGHFTWDLCNMDSEKESEECFSKNKLHLVDGNTKFKLTSKQNGIYKITISFPKGFECKHCVLRWIYRTANSWNFCEDGKGDMGCGNQEHFLSCSDISIER